MTEAVPNPAQHASAALLAHATIREVGLRVGLPMTFAHVLEVA